MTRDEVMTEYVMPTMEAMGGVWTENHSAYIMRRMAQEIARLRATLAVLREPSEAVVDAVFMMTRETGLSGVMSVIPTAVKAAEQEVIA